MGVVSASCCVSVLAGDTCWLCYRLYYPQRLPQYITHTRLMALFPGLPRWAGTGKVKQIWILLKQETVSGSAVSWAICKSGPRSRQITMLAPHHSILRADALPATQPTESKHWRCPSISSTPNHHGAKQRGGLYFLQVVVFVPSVLWRCWLGGRKGIRPVKNWVLRCWRGYLSGARCRLAYGPADATATHFLLFQ